MHGSPMSTFQNAFSRMLGLVWILKPFRKEEGCVGWVESRRKTFVTTQHMNYEEIRDPI